MEPIAITPSLVKTLREGPPMGGKVLTVYLDTSPKRVQGQAFHQVYRELCRETREGVVESERAAFDAAVDHVGHFLEHARALTAPGLAVFASGAGYFHAVPLPGRPRDEVYWELRGHLLPLQSMLDEFERVAVVLFDAERARLFTVYLGAIEEHAAFEDAALPRSKSDGRANLNQTRMRHRRDNLLLRHAKHTVAALNAMNRSHPFDRLFLAGPDEPLATLTHQLPPPLRRRVAGTLHLELFATDAEVLRAILPALSVAEQRAEVALVDEVLDAGAGRGAILGSDEVLAALGEGLVHVLLIAKSYNQSGSECPSCGRLVAGFGTCPGCGTALEPAADLGERVLEQALDEDARIEVVSGEADALLTSRGGLGAWVR